MQSLLQRVQALAESDAPLLIRGEAGAGKEVVARTVHANSSRSEKPFVILNCAASEAAHVNAQLFGGPTQPGLFELARGGTLFLDEVSDLPLDVQARLLRALEDREVRPAGGASVDIDVRVIASTSQDLEHAIREHRFREDLYFRLNVLAITVPPLRERGDDVLALAEMFLEQQAGRQSTFVPTTLAALRAYRWPGNVRELQSAVRHAVAIARGVPIEPAHLPEAVTRVAKVDARLLTLQEAERRHILFVLEACGGQLADTAQVLGIGRTTLWRKLRQYGAVSR